MQSIHVPPANKLFDHLLARFGLKNDAALCRLLKIYPPQLSKTRHGVLPVGATLILAIHEAFDIPVADIRRLAAA